MHAPEFTINRETQKAQAMGMFASTNQFLQHSKSGGNIHQQMQLAAARRHAVQMANLAGPRIFQSTLQHPMHMQLGLRVSVPTPLSVVNSNGQHNEVSQKK